MQIVTNQFQKEMKQHGNYDFPFLVSSERLSKYESGSFLWHWHPEIELTLITKGEMIYEINNNTFHLRKGEALFGNAGSLHSGHMFENQDCEYYSITFDAKLIYGYENSMIYRNYVKPVIHNFSLSAVHFDFSEEWHKEALTMIKEIIQIAAAGSPACEIDIVVHLEQFWKLLFLHSNCLPAAAQYDKRNYDRIRSTLSYIEENYGSTLTLEAIAENIHLCKGECCRIFKKYMKIPLFEFILQYRIEKSLDYLANTKYSIVDIAANVGFNDSNYYSKVFRRQKGCSPTKYRQAMLNQNAGHTP